MIRIPIQLDIFGRGEITGLGDITITNTGSGTELRDNYRWRLFGKSGRLLREGGIENWPRKSKTVALLRRVLNDADL